jgi:hypothetical protein
MDSEIKQMCQQKITTVMLRVRAHDADAGPLALRIAELGLAAIGVNHGAPQDTEEARAEREANSSARNGSASNPPNEREKYRRFSHTGNQIGKTALAGWGGRIRTLQSRVAGFSSMA